MIRAADAERLMRDTTFKAIIEKVRNEQVARFIGSNADGADVREQAHQIIRAIDKIEQALQSVVTDEAIKLKREGHSK